MLWADETEVELFGRKTGHNKSAPTVRSDPPVKDCEVIRVPQGRDGTRSTTLQGKLKTISLPQRFQQEKLGLLESPGLINDHKQIEMLWCDLKREIHTRCSENIAELQQFCKEEWSKMPPLYCAPAGKVVSTKDLSNPKVHILLPHCTMNIYILC